MRLFVLFIHIFYFSTTYASLIFNEGDDDPIKNQKIIEMIKDLDLKDKNELLIREKIKESNQQILTISADKSLRFNPDNQLNIVGLRKFLNLHYRAEEGIEYIQNHFDGICSQYALAKIFNMPRNHPIHNLPVSCIISCLDSSLLYQVSEPQEGDLAVYLNPDINSPGRDLAVHYGISCKDGKIESKWGRDAVYKHPPFIVPLLYGNIIKFYRPTSPLPVTQEELLKKIKLSEGKKLIESYELRAKIRENNWQEENFAEELRKEAQQKKSLQEEKEKIRRQEFDQLLKESEALGAAIIYPL